MRQSTPKVRLCGLFQGHDRFAYSWPAAHPLGRNHVSKTWWTSCSRCGDKAHKGGRRCIPGEAVQQAIAAGGGGSSPAGGPPGGGRAPQGPLPSQEELFNTGSAKGKGGGRKGKKSGSWEKEVGGEGGAAPSSSDLTSYELKADDWLCRICCEELAPGIKQKIWVEVFLALRNASASAAKQIMDKVPNNFGAKDVNFYGSSAPVVRAGGGGGKGDQQKGSAGGKKDEKGRTKDHDRQNGVVSREKPTTFPKPPDSDEEEIVYVKTTSKVMSASNVTSAPAIPEHSLSKGKGGKKGKTAEEQAEFEAFLRQKEGATSTSSSSGTKGKKGKGDRGLPAEQAEFEAFQRSKAGTKGAAKEGAVKDEERSPKNFAAMGTSAVKDEEQPPKGKSYTRSMSKIEADRAAFKVFKAAQEAQHLRSMNNSVPREDPPRRQPINVPVPNTGYPTAYQPSDRQTGKGKKGKGAKSAEDVAAFEAFKRQQAELQRPPPFSEQTEMPDEGPILSPKFAAWVGRAPKDKSHSSPKPHKRSSRAKSASTADDISPLIVPSSPPPPSPLRLAPSAPEVPVSPPPADEEEWGTPVSKKGSKDMARLAPSPPEVPGSPPPADEEEWGTPESKKGSKDMAQVAEFFLGAGGGPREFDRFVRDQGFSSTEEQKEFEEWFQRNNGAEGGKGATNGAASSAPQGGGNAVSPKQDLSSKQDFYGQGKSRPGVSADIAEDIAEDIADYEEFMRGQRKEDSVSGGAKGKKGKGKSAQETAEYEEFLRTQQKKQEDSVLSGGAKGKNGKGKSAQETADYEEFMRGQRKEESVAGGAKGKKSKGKSAEDIADYEEFMRQRKENSVSGGAKGKKGKGKSAQEIAEYEEFLRHYARPAASSAAVIEDPRTRKASNDSSTKSSKYWEHTPPPPEYTLQAVAAASGASHTAAPAASFDGTSTDPGRDTTRSSFGVKTLHVEMSDEEENPRPQKASWSPKSSKKSQPDSEYGPGESSGKKGRGKRGRKDKSHAEDKPSASSIFNVSNNNQAIFSGSPERGVGGGGASIFDQPPGPGGSIFGGSTKQAAPSFFSSGAAGGGAAVGERGAQASPAASEEESNQHGHRRKGGGKGGGGKRTGKGKRS